MTRSTTWFRATAVLLAVLTLYPSCASASFLPTVANRSDQQLHDMTATRIRLENKIVADYLRLRGRSQQSIDQTLQSLTDDQRQTILKKDIPAYADNEAGKTVVTILLSPFILLGVLCSLGSDD